RYPGHPGPRGLRGREAVLRELRLRGFAGRSHDADDHNRGRREGFEARVTQGGHDDWRRPLCRGSADDPVISLHLDPRPAEHPRDPPEEATGHGTASLARHRAGFDVVATCGYIVAVKAVTVRELKNRLKRVSPRGGRRRGRACHGAGPGGGGASTLERRGAP